uniref:Kinesin motor domain-containing protein n=1 Tax=Macrostomum lignano TaxID=282301 RepID=A0A1I8F772_9PLAT
RASGWSATPPAERRAVGPAASRLCSEGLPQAAAACQPAFRRTPETYAQSGAGQRRSLGVACTAKTAQFGVVNRRHHWPALRRSLSAVTLLKSYLAVFPASAPLPAGVLTCLQQVEASHSTAVDTQAIVEAQATWNPSHVESKPPEIQNHVEPKATWNRSPSWNAGKPPGNHKGTTTGTEASFGTECPPGSEATWNPSHPGYQATWNPSQPGTQAPWSHHLEPQSYLNRTTWNRSAKPEQPKPNLESRSNLKRKPPGSPLEPKPLELPPERNPSHLETHSAVEARPTQSRTSSASVELRQSFGRQRRHTVTDWPGACSRRHPAKGVPAGGLRSDACSCLSDLLVYGSPLAGDCQRLVQQRVLQLAGVQTRQLADEGGASFQGDVRPAMSFTTCSPRVSRGRAPSGVEFIRSCVATIREILVGGLSTRSGSTGGLDCGGGVVLWAHSVSGRRVGTLDVAAARTRFMLCSAATFWSHLQGGFEATPLAHCF